MHTLEPQTALDNGFNLLAAGLMIAVALGFLVLFVAALVSVLRSRLSGGMKLVWVVFAFCAPFLGSLLWFVVGRKNAERSFA
ncbi:PLD nuclease N-terminal domain-containing protein [Umezawaea sp. Da 62-37]|uniref:PLD nuclease N-terminal domain-containing protein n=1 Tax=Umezawaea sp. Da 62-37 TaxID=3075927 RepID=UPI0028F6F321|nr:PLD nuclease N-terminal domain-containing protein [Umezawaea sp. Da 62-37]WNV89039.1 PLD nuclease N-terminal domain-containing protein [Umezawaea sp. Da 62-37]